MRITDLSYLEIIPELHCISGAAGVDVSANALAEGDLTFTLTDADVKAKMLPSGVSMAKGRITAIAIGDNPLVEITMSGSGDRVIEKTKTHYFKNKNMLVVRGFIKAIDHP